MPRLCLILGNWRRILFMWKKCKTTEKDQRVRQEELWRLINSQLRHQKRTSPMVPNMELPNGNDCTTKPRRCCRKLANPSMVVTKPFWKDGTRMTPQVFVRYWVDWGAVHAVWRTCIGRPLLKLQQERKELVTRKVGCSRWMKKVFKDHWINVLISLKQKEHLRHCMMNVWKRLPKEIQKRTRQRRDRQFEGLEEYDCQADPQTGWRTYLPFEVTGNPAASNIFVFINSMGTARLEVE